LITLDLALVERRHVEEKHRDEDNEC